VNALFKWLTTDYNWLWIWVFWGVIGSLFEGVRDFFVVTWNKLVHGRQEREIALMKERRKLARAEAELEAAKGGQGRELPKPGPCVHRNVVPVIPATEDKVSGWLCRTCDAQLPADWAMREEDL
jgi:hypothetical protein